MMNLFIAACVVTMAVGAPLPGNVYYGLPSDHYFGSYFPAYFGSAFSPIKYTLGAIAPKQTHLILKPDNSELEKQDDTTSAPVQEIKLIIGIPVIPEGSSVSINVKVDSLPSGPVVSVSNPTTITGSPATPDDAIIVDVGVDGGSGNSNNFVNLIYSIPFNSDQFLVINITQFEEVIDIKYDEDCDSNHDEKIFLNNPIIKYSE